MRMRMRPSPPYRPPPAADTARDASTPSRLGGPPTIAPLAGLAQLVEHPPCKRKVVRSIRTAGTNPGRGGGWQPTAGPGRSSHEPRGLTLTLTGGKCQPWPARAASMSGRHWRSFAAAAAWSARMTQAFSSSGPARAALASSAVSSGATSAHLACDCARRANRLASDSLSRRARSTGSANRAAPPPWAEDRGGCVTFGAEPGAGLGAGPCAGAGATMQGV